LQLHARDIATSAEGQLPDGTLAETYQVSLPVIAEPTNANETFTWLVGVQEDGHFLGYMRYPSTFDPHTNSLNFELTGQGLQTITVLPVIILRRAGTAGRRADRHPESRCERHDLDRRFGSGPGWQQHGGQPTGGCTRCCHTRGCRGAT
jgi:hypothetical protein